MTKVLVVQLDAEDAASHKGVIQNGSSMPRTILQTVGNSILVSSQN